MARQGWRSIWKAEYSIVDDRQSQQYLIREESAWVRVLDGLVGEIPVLGIFTGYVFNPTYLVTNNQGQVLYRLKKQPSLFGREFEVDKLGNAAHEEDERVLLALMMMILLERHRG